MLFQFEHMDQDSQPGSGKWALKPLHLPDLKHTMQRWQDALHGQQGTPYVYQGEELGMTNTPFARIEDCRDIESINHYRAALQRGQQPEEVMAAIRAKGRDNARTPMPWGVRPQAGPHAGFTTGTPWLALNPNFDQINAEQALADTDSVFHHYRQLIQLRRQHPVWVQGRTLPLLAEHSQIAAYLRVWRSAQLLVVCNFSAELLHFEAPLADAPACGWQMLLGNWPVDPAEVLRPDLPAFALRPYEARIYLGTSV